MRNQSIATHSKSANQSHSKIRDLLPSFNSGTSSLQPQDNSYFQSFIFTDQITNNKFDLQQCRSCDTSPLSYQRYGDCMALVKETKKFHLNSLKTKNYKKSNKVNASLIECLSKARGNTRGMRKKQQQEQYQCQKHHLSILLSPDRQPLHTTADASPQKFAYGDYPTLHSTYVGSPDAKRQQSNPKNDQNSFDFRSTKTNKKLSKILKYPSHSPKQHGEHKITDNGKKCKYLFNSGKRQRVDFREESQLTKSEQKIVENLNKQLRSQIIKNSQYLIKPDLHKVHAFGKSRVINQKHDKQELIKDWDGQIGRQYQQKLNANAQDLANFNLGDYNFQNQGLLKIAERHRVKAPAKCEHQSTQAGSSIFDYVKSGNYFKVQIELSLNPTLLQTRDNNSLNNILHICILYNQPDIFKLATTKSKQHGVDLLHQPNKYNKTPIQMARALQLLP